MTEGSGAMRNYQPKNGNPYYLPHNVYMQCLYAVRDYDRIKRDMQDVMYASPVNDGQPRGSDTIDTTANKAIKLEALQRQCDDIERASIRIPGEYRKGVLDNIMYGGGYPIGAHKSTYSRWRVRFLYFLAKNKNFI